MTPRPSPLGASSAGLLTIAVSSVVRACAAGTLRVDQAPISASARFAVGALYSAGLALLLWGYVAGLRSDAPPIRRIIALHVLAALALPLTSNDAFLNLRYGELLLHGTSPYSAPPDALTASVLASWVRRWNDVRCPYGPLTVLLDAGSAAVGHRFGVYGMLVAFKLAMLAVSIGTAFALASLPGVRRRPARVWLAAANPLLLVEIAGQAHNDGLMVLCLACALGAALSGRGAPAGVWLGLGVAAKLPAVVPLGVFAGWLLWRDRIRGARALAAAVAVLVCVYLPFWDRGAALAGTLRELGAGKLSQSLLRVIAVIARDATSPHHGAVLMIARILALGAVLSVAVAAIRRLGRPRADPWRATAWILFVYLLVAVGWFQVWYLTWLVVLLPVAELRLRIGVTAATLLCCVGVAARLFDPRTGMDVTVAIATHVLPILFAVFGQGARLRTSVRQGPTDGAAACPASRLLGRSTAWIFAARSRISFRDT